MSTDEGLWNPGLSVDDHRKCRGCGAHVTPDTRRVMGDEDRVVHHCPRCITYRDLQNGAAASADYDPETDRIKSTQTGYHPMGGSE